MKWFKLILNIFDTNLSGDKYLSLRNLWFWLEENNTHWQLAILPVSGLWNEVLKPPMHIRLPIVWLCSDTLKKYITLQRLIQYTRNGSNRGTVKTVYGILVYLNKYYWYMGEGHCARIRLEMITEFWTEILKLRFEFVDPGLGRRRSYSLLGCDTA